MKTFIAIYIIICLFSISCNINYSKTKRATGFYNTDSLYNLESKEIRSLKDSNISKLSIDSMEAYLLNYRYKLSEILKKENKNFRFNRAFLIEDFFVYKKGYRVSIRSDYLYDYRAILYMENEEVKMFLDIEIAKNSNLYKIKKVRLIHRKRKFIQNFFNKKTFLNHQNINSCSVFEAEEQYAILSKISLDEKFCRIIINPFWNSFYSNNSNSLNQVDTVQFSNYNDFIILQLMTGNGASF